MAPRRGVVVLPPLRGSSFDTVDATPGASDTARTCPVCRGANALAREVCGRCGVDLDTGAPLPTAALASPFRSVARSSRLRRWWLPIVAIVAVITGIITGLGLLRAGPADPEPQIPEVTFDPAGYGETSEALPLSSVATLTTGRSEGDRAFTPEHLGDDDAATAWRSDVDELPEGTNEVIDLFLEEPAWVSQLVIHNGDHLDASAYEATARIRQARLIFDGGTEVTVNLLDLGRAPQAIDLPEPVLTTTVRIEVLSAVPGGADTDVAVSETAPYGFVADPSDRELAERRAELEPATAPIAVVPS